MRVYIGINLRVKTTKIVVTERIRPVIKEWASEVSEQGGVGTQSVQGFPLVYL